jgi:EAL domain-containing protein (putative c-di-GMP-specific phosphodiesterase class I)
LAEQTDLIVPLGRWVLGEACRAARDWPDELLVSVNLSPAHSAQ